MPNTAAPPLPKLPRCPLLTENAPKTCVCCGRWWNGRTAASQPNNVRPISRPNCWIAASRPDQAAAYTAALLILLQSAIMHRRHSTELGLCRDRYRRENIGCRLPETMRQALDEAFAAAEKHGLLA